MLVLAIVMVKKYRMKAISHLLRDFGIFFLRFRVCGLIGTGEAYKIEAVRENLKQVADVVVV